MIAILGGRRWRRAFTILRSLFGWRCCDCFSDELRFWRFMHTRMLPQLIGAGKAFAAVGALPRILFFQQFLTLHFVGHEQHQFIFLGIFLAVANAELLLRRNELTTFEIQFAIDFVQQEILIHILRGQ